MSKWLTGNSSRRWKRKRDAIIERDGYQCVHCHEPGTVDTLTVDHIVPKRFGGSNDPGNLRSLCRPCHDDVTHQWHPDIGYYSPRGLRLLAAHMLAKGEPAVAMPSRVRAFAFDMTRLKHHCRV